MSIKILRDIAFAAAVLSTAGCATLFNGFSQRIEVTSEPPGAEVFVGGERAGTTPTEVVVSRRATQREFRVVDEAGNSEYRWVRSRMSERAWLNIFSGLFVGYGAWFRSAEDKLEGNIGVGVLGFMVPWVVDLALGGMHEFPDRLDFSPRSAVRREPGSLEPVRPAQPYRGVLQGDVQPPPRLDVAPAVHVRQLHDLLERRRKVRGGVQVPVAGRPHSPADRPHPVAAGTETRATAGGAAVTLPGAGRVLGSPGGGQR